MRTTFEWCVNGPWTTGGEDVQWRMERDADIVRLAFQGSVSESDWLHNLDIAVVPYRQMHESWLCHRGFLRLWKSVKADIMEGIVSHLDAGAKVVVTSGYSQGGALATLAYEDIWYHLGARCSVAGRVFGCPRVLWLPEYDVCARFNNLSRYSVRGDIVTMIPPILMGYVHVGREHLLGPRSLPSAKRHLKSEYLKHL